MSTVKANTIEPASGGTVTITGASLTTPAIGTPASGTLTNCTGLPASSVVNTPAGGISATTVQGALEELDSEKVSKSGGTMTDNLTFTSGKGIDFSATPGTGTSELLADYEEGTWTPADASGAGLSIAITSGTTPKYTRIGNVVFFSADITYPSTANSNTAKISLPLATTSSNPLGTGSVGYKSDGVEVYPSVSSSGVEFLSPVNTFQTNANLSGVRFVFSGTYFAA